MDNLELIFEEINKIKDQGHLVFIKFDGEREKEMITVVLSLTSKGEREVIQRHGDNLLILLNKLLKDYENFLSSNAVNNSCI